MPDGSIFRKTQKHCAQHNSRIAVRRLPAMRFKRKKILLAAVIFLLNHATKSMGIGLREIYTVTATRAPSKTSTSSSDAARKRHAILEKLVDNHLHYFIGVFQRVFRG